MLTRVSLKTSILISSLDVLCMGLKSNLKDKFINKDECHAESCNTNT